MGNMENFINKFKNKSRHHNKLINFIYPELKNIENSNILEFGVSEKAMSTELFLEHSSKTNCKLFSIDNVDFSKKFDNTLNFKGICSDYIDRYKKIVEKIKK